MKENTATSIVALGGLGEVGKKSVLKSTPEVLGLVRKVQHCLKVVELD